MIDNNKNKADQNKSAEPEIKNPSTADQAPSVESSKLPKDPKDQASTTEEVEVPKEFKDLVEKIESMRVIEMSKLVGILEKKFGVSAQMVVAAGPATLANETDSEKDSFTVELTAVGDQKIQVIKAVKEALGLGLKEAKDLVDGAPSVLKEEAKKEEAETIKKIIETAGGKVQLK